MTLQLSLLIAVLQEYEGSMASDTYQEYLEVAGELFRKPAMTIQLAIQEHERRTDDDSQHVLPENQQTLSDSLEYIVDIPGSASIQRPTSRINKHTEYRISFSDDLATSRDPLRTKGSVNCGLLSSESYTQISDSR
ncbi:MAG: hypothetical protein V5A62_15990 [Haloarculaceae archaeon]